MKLIVFNKPFGVLSQFRTDTNNTYETLAKYFTDNSLRVAGRLDATSEGLLFLTDDGHLNHYLSTPKSPHNKQHGKTYWAQVAGMATPAQLAQLRDGVVLKDGKTMPAIVRILTKQEVATLWQAPQGVAVRKVTTWLAITLFEGKNRQVRRMTASVGLPCLRLVRVSAYGFCVLDLQVGQFLRYTKQQLIGRVPLAVLE